jgi:phage terminase large subunit-like protein
VFGEQSSWYDADVIYKLSRKFEWENLNRMYGQTYGVAAVDLSVKGDMTAVTYMSYSVNEGKFFSKTKYYMPEQSVVNHPNAQLYRDWAEKGYLILLPGSAIDASKIADLILEENNTGGIALTKIGFDPYKSADLVNRLTAYIGKSATKILSPIKQPISNFTASVAKMNLLTDQERIVFDENPITPWCFSNAVLAEDNNGNCKPMKRTTDSPQKIDGAITNLMCLNLFAELGV